VHRDSSIRTVVELNVFVEDIATAGQTCDGCRRLSSSVRPLSVPHGHISKTTQDRPRITMGHYWKVGIADSSYGTPSGLTE